MVANHARCLVVDPTFLAIRLVQATSEIAKLENRNSWLGDVSRCQCEVDDFEARLVHGVAKESVQKAFCSYGFHFKGIASEKGWNAHVPFSQYESRSAAWKEPATRKYNRAWANRKD